MSRPPLALSCLALPLVCCASCFSPNEMLQGQGDTDVPSTSTGGTIGTSTGTFTTSSGGTMTAPGSSTELETGEPTGSSSVADDATGGSTGAGSEDGTVAIVNAQVGDVVSVCIGRDNEASACTGPIAPHDSAELSVPIGEVQVSIDPSLGDKQIEVVTFSREPGFLGVAAVGAAGPTPRLEVSALTAEQRSAGEVLVVNSVDGLGSVGVGGTELGAWTTTVVTLEADRRVLVQTDAYPFAVSAPPQSRGAWAVVLTGDAAADPESELGLGGVFVSEGESHYSSQDAAVTFATPRYLSFYSGGPPDNVICVDGEPLAVNVIGLDIAGPFPLPPVPSTVSLHSGSDCDAAVLAEQELSLVVATRQLVAFAPGDTVEVFEEDFSQPSESTEYRVLNFYLDSSNETSTVWFGLIDDNDGSFVETIVSALPAVQESASFSLSAADATGTDYFLGYRTSLGGNADAEIAWPHEDGARDWWVLWDSQFVAVDVSVWPWLAEE